MWLWLLGRKWRQLRPCGLPAEGGVGRPNRGPRSSVSGPLGIGCRDGLGRAHRQVEAQCSPEGDQSPGLSPPTSPSLRPTFPPPWLDRQHFQGDLPVQKVEEALLSQRGAPPVLSCGLEPMCYTVREGRA